jgi:hypothetical protein
MRVLETTRYEQLQRTRRSKDTQYVRIQGMVLVCFRDTRELG